MIEREKLAIQNIGIDFSLGGDKYVYIQHHVRQENDEYACACGRRWDIADGEDHP